MIYEHHYFDCVQLHLELFGYETIKKVSIPINEKGVFVGSQKELSVYF